MLKDQNISSEKKLRWERAVGNGEAQVATRATDVHAPALRNADGNGLQPLTVEVENLPDLLAVECADRGATTNQAYEHFVCELKVSPNDANVVGLKRETPGSSIARAVFEYDSGVCVENVVAVLLVCFVEGCEVLVFHDLRERGAVVEVSVSDLHS